MSYEKKKKLLLQPEKSKGSSKKAKHLQDASQIDALYELPDLSLAELQQKLEEEALIQRADAHQARDSELQMDEYLLDQPNEAAGLDDLEDDGFDYTFVTPHFSQLFASQENTFHGFCGYHTFHLTYFTGLKKLTSVTAPGLR